MRIVPHNQFTVTANGETASATGYNTLNEYFYAFNRGALTADIALGHGDTLLAVLPAAVVSYNADVSVGGLYVCRAATLNGELDEGVVISWAGFTPDGGSTLLNRAELPPVTVGTAVYSVEGTLYLSVEGDAAFTAGDNPLVRTLLGLERFDHLRLELATGLNRHPNAVMARGTRHIADTVPATCGFGADFMAMLGVLKSPQNEILFMYNDVPVVRTFVPRTGGTALRTVPVTPGGYAYFGDDAAGAFNLRRGATAVTDYTQHRRPSLITADCPVLYPARLEKCTALIGEPGGQFAALVGEREVTVLTLVGGHVAVHARLPVEFRRGSLLSDGSLLCRCADGLVRRVGLDAGAMSVTEVEALAGADDVCAVLDASGLFAAATVNGRVVAGSVLGDVFTGAYDAAYTGELRLFVFDAGRIAAAEPAAYSAVILSARGESVALGQKAGAYFGANPAASPGYLGLAVSQREDSAVITDFDTGTSVQIPGRVHVVGDVAVAENATGAYVADKGGGAPVKISSDVEVSGMSSGVRLGDYLMWLVGGRAVFAYLSPLGLGVCCPGLSGGTVSATVILKAAPPSSANGCRVTLTMTDES